MKVYVFGNEDLAIDNLAINISKNITIPEVDFVYVKPNQDFEPDEKKVVIMDNIIGVDKVCLFTEKELEKVKTSPRFSAHDFDLGFQLKYLTKLGKISEILIIGIPTDSFLSLGQIITSVESILIDL